ncbi:MAG: adenine deaminase [Thermoleophilia bacterium]|nr:adenine deaminase [Thermoleophilia bacterium]
MSAPDGPATSSQLAHLIAVARGDADPDLVISGARVFLAHTREFIVADVAVADGRIAGIGDFSNVTASQNVSGRGRYLIPGLIDAHMHIESSKLTPARFAEAVLRHGTTCIIAEPHEIGNVLGTRGVQWCMDAASGLPLEMYFMSPSCVPASQFESPREAITPGDMADILRHPRALGIGEMMNFPGVIAGAGSELAKLSVRGDCHVDGHAPGVSGRALDAYVAAGIGSDHESTTWEEALEKRRRGMWVLLREASNARNLLDLLPMVRTYGPDNCAFCTDDREPDMLLRDGHINQMVRIAVADGLPVEDALVMATLNAARAHGLDKRGHGAIAPGYHANMVLLDDLIRFDPVTVWSRGKVVAELGRVVEFAADPAPAWVCKTVNVAPVSGSSFALKAPAGSSQLATPSVRVRAIGAIEGQLITEPLEVEVPVSDGLMHADPATDLAKIAVVERHHATGRIGSAFVRGFQLKRGAFASTVAHDAHNIVVVGTDDDSMATCVRRLAELGGGIVVCDGDQVMAELALPVAGLMSDEPVEVVAEAMDRCHAALAQRGVTVDAPFMILSFLALSVIPSLKLTDHGLVDVDTFQLVPLIV